MEGTVTIATLLSAVTTFVTQSINWVGSWASTIVEQPFLLLAVVAIPVAGFGIGALRRLTKLRT